MRKVILILLIVACCKLVKAQHPGYTSITDIAKLEEQFTAITRKTETIKSDFVQDKNLSMLSEKIISKGKFWFKKESLLRMEYEKPYEYLMILNKDVIYIKDGKKETKVSLKSNKIFQQVNKIIVDCVQGTVFDNPDFTTKVFENSGTYMVELSPVTKGLKDFFKNIDVVIDKKDYSVTTIIMNENSGDNTVLHFTNRAFNTPIPDAIFAIK